MSLLASPFHVVVSIGDRVVFGRMHSRRDFRVEGPAMLWFRYLVVAAFDVTLDMG